MFEFQRKYPMNPYAFESFLSAKQGFKTQDNKFSFVFGQEENFKRFRNLLQSIKHVFFYIKSRRGRFC